ncbi:hypothetical protein [Microbacterium sp. KRD172]|uniref:hypothetical protein n=1 Tax=Microbacterium sp. KRD172 TaxID=2729727 RepID=UPI0019D2C0BA|nr:hypothetical protein [Microbacterium sp. KRD172]
MFDSLLPNVVGGAGVVLFVVGSIALLTSRDRFARTSGGVSRLLWSLGVCEVAVVLWIAALWIDGTAWLPGRIIATVAVLAGLAFVVPRMRRIARAPRSAPAADVEQVQQ